MEEDGVAEALAVAEAPRPALDRLDLLVDRLRPGVGDAMLEEGADVRPVTLEHLRHAADRLEATAACPMEPALEVAISSGLRVEFPQLHGGLPERPGARHGGDDLAQQGEGAGFRPAASLPAAQPIVLRALEDRIALGHPVAVFALAHLVHRLAE